MDFMDTLQMLICLSEETDSDIENLEEEELFEAAYTQGWACAARMAIRNSGYCFDDPRDAVEVLFEELADGEDGDDFVDVMLSIAFGRDEELDDEGDSGKYRHKKSAYEEGNMALGKRGEDAAARCLVSKGYEILKRNFEGKDGEIDIIAKDPDGVVVFIEVKTRRSMKAGMPEEAITRAKRRRYENLALEYMSQGDWEDGTPIRFDAICICVKGDDRAVLRHHMGFFDVC